MLEAFFDASGTDGKVPVVSIAGYVGTKEQWTSLEAEWQKRLENFDVENFHMTACIAGKDQFADMEQADRHQLAYNLVDIIRATKNPGCVVGR